MEGEFTIEVALQKLKKLAKKINKTQQVKLNSVQELEDLYHGIEGEDLKNMLGDSLAKFEIGVIFKKTLMKEDQSSELTKLLLRVCWNYSHASQNIAEEFGRVGIIALLLSSLQKNIKNQTIQPDDIVSRLGILYNCAKAAKNRKLFRRSNATDTLLHYSESERKTINVVAILTLSYIVDEEKYSLLSTDASVIDTITSLLEKAVKSETHKVDGWTAYELTAGLENLSMNADNTEMILKKEILPSLLQLFMEGNDDEQEVSGQTIWMLAFHDEVKQKLMNDENVMKFLREMNNDDGSMGKTAHGILWILGEGKTEKREIQTEKSSQHIMISYQWSSQALMNQIYEELTSLGYNVWMDIHDLNGSILEAMASAVENASLVLVCMTQKYKDSPNCRTEAEYTFNLRKKIIPIKAEQDFKASGWLGALVGTKLYIDFSSLESFEGETFDQKVSELVTQINATGLFDSKTAEKETKEDKTEDKSSSDNKTSPTGKKDEKPASDRTAKEWMTEHGLTSTEMKNLTTQELHFLSDLKHKSPDIFYQFLAGEIGVRKLREIIKISCAIDEFQI